VSWKRSTAVAASACDARIKPLWPIDMRLLATTGQACHGTPFGAVGTEKGSVGTTQLTSPTSVDPPGGSLAIGSRSHKQPA
jgi:hypothetical protein